MVAVGYHITRGVFLTAYGVLVLLFSIQCRIQFVQDGGRSFLSFKTVHSTFILGGLSMSILTFITFIDGSSVFDIYPLIFPELAWIISVSIFVTCYLFLVYIAIRSLYSMSSEECEKYKRRARFFMTCLVVVNWFNVVAHGIWFIATRRWTPNVISWSITELIITTSVVFETRIFMAVSRRLKGGKSPQLKRWKRFTIISTSVIPLVALIHIYLNLSYLFGPDRASLATDDFYSRQQWEEHTRVLLLSGVWMGTATMLVIAWKPLKAGEDDGNTRKPGLTGASASSHWYKFSRRSLVSRSGESQLSVPSKHSVCLDGLPASAEARQMTPTGEGRRMSVPKRQSEFGLITSVEPPQQSEDGPPNSTEAQLMTPSRKSRMTVPRRQSEVGLPTSAEAHRMTPSVESRMSVPKRQSDLGFLTNVEPTRQRGDGLPTSVEARLMTSSSKRRLIVHKRQSDDLSKSIEAHFIMMGASRESQLSVPPRQRGDGLPTSVEAHLMTSPSKRRMTVPQRQGEDSSISRSIEAHLIMMAASRKSRRNLHAKSVPIAQERPPPVVEWRAAST